MIFYHECWLDEAHAYIIAKYKNVWEIFQHARFDGHPVLWHLILKATLFFKLPYVSIQVINTTFNCIAVWLLIKYSPFHRIFKYLLVLGYFIFFEYNIVARNYSLFMLLLFLIAVIYESKENKRYSYILLLLLLAFTHFFGLILSGLIFVYSFITEDRIKKPGWVIPLSLGCIGYLLICILLFRFPNEASLIPYNQSITLESIISQLSVILNSLLLIPGYFYSFEIDDIVSVTKLVISIIVFIALTYYMVHKKQLIFMLLIYLVIILAFRIFIYSGGIWNIGVIWLAIIFFSWISPNSHFKSIQLSYSSIIIIAILIFHCVYAFEWIYLDKNFNFSSAKKYANYINSYSKTHNHLSLYFNFNDPWWGESIVPYLDDNIKIYGIDLVPVQGDLNTKNCLIMVDNFAVIGNNKEILFSSSEPELRGRCNFLIKKFEEESSDIDHTLP